MLRVIIIIIVGITVSSFILSSCVTYPCGKASSSIALISFTDPESDTIIIRRFVKGANFSNLKDSAIITRDGRTNFQRQHDTLLILHSNVLENNLYNDITSDYDFEIVLPKVPRVYRLSEIVEDIQYGKNNGQKIYCVNGMKSYKIDGQLKINAGYENIYLKK